MKTYVLTEDVDFNIVVGDVVGVRSLIAGYGEDDWKLIEADYYGESIPERDTTSYSADGKTWSHAGRAEITKITTKKIHFSLIG
jgi:hypothetical protein